MPHNIHTNTSLLESVGNSKERDKVKLGLNRIRSCLNYIGNPEKKFKSVIIGGTNGKGSVTYFLSNLTLKYTNLKVGRYTSPHLIRFNERFVINESPISNEELNNLTKEIMPLIKEYEAKNKAKLTSFEIYTIFAFYYFAKEKIDIAFLEVGMGGRLDATNVTDSENTICSIITNVSIEHSNILGGTIKQIAFEKAGIIKENNFLITACTDSALKVVTQQAKELNTGVIHLNHADKDSFIDKNIALTLTAWKFITERLDINDKFSNEDKIKFLKSLQFPGRFHLTGNILLDCAHNPGGAIELKALIDKYFFRKNTVYIIGMLDKDYKSFINNLIPPNSIVICTEPKSYRATKKELLADIVQNKKSKAILADDIQTAIELGKSLNHELIIITGSVYLIGEALSVI